MHAASRSRTQSGDQLTIYDMKPPLHPFNSKAYIPKKLLDRCICIFGFVQGWEYKSTKGRQTSASLAAVIDHIASEIDEMLQRNPDLTPHQLVTMLRLESAGEFAGWRQDFEVLP